MDVIWTLKQRYGCYMDVETTLSAYRTRNKNLPILTVINSNIQTFKSISIITVLRFSHKRLRVNASVEITDLILLYLKQTPYVCFIINLD